MRFLSAFFLLWLQLSDPSKLHPSAELKKLDYFLGSWAFEWNVPESPLGPGGKVKGTERYRRILDGFFYESDIDGDGPLGAFHGRAIMGYNEMEKVFVRYEFDSLGTALLKTGSMGGDAGGWNMIYWEASPILRNGKTVKVKGSTHMYSPVSYRVRMQISVDGGPYLNYGNPWFRKIEPAR